MKTLGYISSLMWMQIPIGYTAVSNLSQYSQSTVVEICKQDLYTLKGANPTVMALINQ